MWCALPWQNSLFSNLKTGICAVCSPAGSKGSIVDISLAGVHSRLLAVKCGLGAVATVPAHPRRRPDVTPSPPTVRRRRSDRSTTSSRPQNVRQRHVSPSASHRSVILGRFPHPSNCFRWINSTSCRGRHPKLNLVDACLWGTVIGIGDCLGGKRANYQVCSVQYCAQ